MIDVARIFGAPVTDAGGKSAPNTSASDTPRRRSARDGGRELPHRRVSLRVAERVDMHRSDLRDPSKVVPHHVDDHDVLRALLLGVHEPMAYRGVGRGIQATRRRPLHRSGVNAIAAALEEELG